MRSLTQIETAPPERGRPAPAGARSENHPHPSEKGVSARLGWRIQLSADQPEFRNGNTPGAHRVNDPRGRWWNRNEHSGD